MKTAHDILNMLASGKISAEEAERLLDALGRRPEPRAPRPPRAASTRAGDAAVTARRTEVPLREGHQHRR